LSPSAAGQEGFEDARLRQHRHRLAPLTPNPGVVRSENAAECPQSSAPSDTTKSIGAGLSQSVSVARTAARAVRRRGAILCSPPPATGACAPWPNCACPQSRAASASARPDPTGSGARRAVRASGRAVAVSASRWRRRASSNLRKREVELQRRFVGSWVFGDCRAQHPAPAPGWTFRAATRWRGSRAHGGWPTPACACRLFGDASGLGPETLRDRRDADVPLDCGDQFGTGLHGEFVGGVVAVVIDREGS
jgi:hypothetical protein